MENKYKAMIPNILTITRIVLTPIIIILGLTKNYLPMIIVTLFATITDLFDGALARKWNVISLKGAKLDAVADKVFAIGIIGGLVNKFNILIYILILEIILGLSNLYYHYKTNKTESLLIGKIKTTSLFITIIICLISILFKNFDNIILGFGYVTINLQVLSILSYLFNFVDNIKNKPSINDNKMHNEIMNNDEYKSNLENELEDTIVLNNIQELEKNIYNYEDEN